MQYFLYNLHIYQISIESFLKNADNYKMHTNFYSLKLIELPLF